MIALRVLAPYAGARPKPREGARCELCDAPLGDVHRHVAELTTGAHGVKCACHACAILFAAGTRFRTIPDRVRRDREFALDAAAWAQLGVPVALAFFVRSAGTTRVGYPGAAGVVDGELDETVWTAVAGATPLARELADDVEALLVRGARGAHKLACYLVPVTRAYELAGALRESWRGFSGGDDAHARIAGFFATLDREAR
ncbi:MAG TPA: DUF5947 family protein [Kofleriaceae bacterium]